MIINGNVLVINNDMIIPNIYLLYRSTYYG